MKTPATLRTASSFASLSVVLFASLMAGCSNAPARVKDPSITAESRRVAAERDRMRKAARSLPSVMIGLDQSLDKYWEAVFKGGDPRANDLAEVLEKTIRDKTIEFFDVLIAKADNAREAGHRSIALAALGFVDQPQSSTDAKPAKSRPRGFRNFEEAALNSLVSAIGDRDETVVLAALLGLAKLRSNHTPIEDVGAMLENEKLSDAVRENASLVLVHALEGMTPANKQRVRPFLQRVLSQPLGDVEPPVAVHCLAAIGRLRHRDDAKFAETYCLHPTAQVRIRAAIALGLLRNQDSVESLLAMIEPAETNMNVRLAARKALKALAGGRDHRYDVKAWRHTFTRK